MIYIGILIILGILAISDFISIKPSESNEILNVENNVKVGRRSSRNASNRKKQLEDFSKGNKIGNVKAIIFIIICLILIIVAGFRYYTGLDYSNYTTIFYNIEAGNKVGIELGFKIANKIIAICFGTPQMMFLIFAFATIVIKAFVIKKSSDKVFFALLIMYALYFLVGDMGQIRSTFAQSLDLLALYLYIRKQRILAFILVLFAVLFHSSAIVFLLLFIVGARKYHTAIITGFLVVLGVLGQIISLDNVSSIIQSLPSVISSHIPEFLMTKLNYYTSANIQAMGLSFMLLLEIIILIFLLAVKEIYKLNNRVFNILLNLYVLSVASMLLLNQYFIIGTRFANYFKLSLIILIPYAISKIENKKVRLCAVFVFVLIFSLLTIRFLQGNIVHYLPYRMNIFGNIIG